LNKLGRNFSPGFSRPPLREYVRIRDAIVQLARVGDRWLLSPVFEVQKVHHNEEKNSCE
jgi:hypothetical protein